MGNQESQPFTKYSFYLPETKGYFGQQLDGTMSCSIEHQHDIRFWNVLPVEKSDTVYMRACGLYFLIRIKL